MLASRKQDHLRICLEEDVRSRGVGTGLERYRFVHRALPELDLLEVDLRTVFLGKELRCPILISSMTGGTSAARAVNRRLAEAAAATGSAMAVGSQRIAIEDPEWSETFGVRDTAPQILLLANLGAVQLVHGYGPEHCQRAVDMIRADGLVLHLNPLQEALQPTGDTQFRGLLRRIEGVCRTLSVPVIVKEVGYGLSTEVARQLAEVGVRGLDVAGAGGTSWSEVERYRAADPGQARVAAAFADWGIPTADSVVMARAGAPDLPIIASGGMETGIDIAKCIALGADLVGVARPLLRPALLSSQAVMEELQAIVHTLRIAMFCVGARDVATLQHMPCLQEIHG